MIASVAWLTGDEPLSAALKLRQRDFPGFYAEAA